MIQKRHFIPLLLILGAWPGASCAQATTADAVGAWGNNDYGQTTVPVAAQSGVTAIAAGLSHTVALKSDGSVVAWGRNDYGQTDVPVAAQSGVTAVAAGESSTIALRNNGTVVVWGRVFDGTDSVAAPEGLSDVMAIAAGGEHFVAVRSDGSVVAWGWNAYHQADVPSAARSGVRAVAAGEYNSVALKTDGSVVAWGESDEPVPPGLSGVTAIAAGGTHVLALKSDGSVVAWGDNYWGQSTVPLQAQSGVTAIAAGGNYSVALKDDGTIVAWGGRIFDGTAAVAATVPPGLTGVKAIAAGGDHTVAIAVPAAPIIATQPVSQAVALWQRAAFTVTATGFPLNYQWQKNGVNISGAIGPAYIEQNASTNRAGNYTVVVGNILGSVTSTPPAVLTVNLASPGSVVAWGNNDLGQATVPVAAQSGVTAIAAGADHTVALKTDGTVVEWGSIYDGTNQVAATVPAGLNGVMAIAAGGDFAAALRADGSLVIWGNGPPGTVPLAAQSGVKAIAAGDSFIVALKADGTVVSWGVYDFDIWVSVPEGLTGVTAIAAGVWHTVALKNDGSVQTWGDDTGLGLMPVPLAARSGVKAILAGGNLTVAIKNDGSVVAWGDDPTYGQTLLPAAAQSAVTAFAGGGNHTVALKSDGSVVGWGYNYYGEATGTPTTVDPFTAGGSPVALAGQTLTGVTAIAAGYFHTVALLGIAVPLQARRNEHDVVLWWPADKLGFTLQSTFSLTPPVTWIDLTNPPTVVGAQFTVTNPSSRSPQFFRLERAAF